MDLSDIQSDVNDFLLTTQRRPRGSELTRSGAISAPFSPFSHKDLEHALAIAREFGSLAEEHGGGRDGLHAVVGDARARSQSEDVMLIRYALQLFITRDPLGQLLRIPNLREELRAKGGELRAKRPKRSPGENLARVGAVDPDESLMEFFRFDPDLNDHHRHWHLLYTGNNSIEGELFFYMHQQMLARYEAERYALGLPDVTPYGADHSGFQESLKRFAPPQSVLSQGYAARVEGAASAYPGKSYLGQMTKYASAINSGLSTGKYTTINDIGNEVEAMHGMGYSGLHNTGHVIVSAITASPGEMNVMGDPAYSMMDPVFYRWHTRIDHIRSIYKQLQPAYDFSDAPPVKMRKGTNAHTSPDIILCSYTTVNPTDDPKLDYESFGEREFGGSQWDQDPLSHPGVLTTLRTSLTEENWLRFEDPFFYFVRAENVSGETQNLTVRIFIAAVDLVDNRDRWIELDKFKAMLGPNAKRVLARPCWFSTVIRQAEVPRHLQPRVEHDPGPAGTYCDCGLPYRMLLPRGRADGMPFALFVMLSDGYDQTNPDSACGSISYCGRKQREYPDKRAMGYPFDRRWTQPISVALLRQPTMATLGVTIRAV